LPAPTSQGCRAQAALAAQAYRGYDPRLDENFDAAGDSMDEEDWERASAILLEGTSVEPPPFPARAAQRRPSRFFEADAVAERRPSRFFEADNVAERRPSSFFEPDVIEERRPSRFFEADVIAERRGTPVAQRSRSSSRPGGWFSRFVGKLHAAWVIFFPDVPRRRAASGRECGLERLKVVLVADRVGMTSQSFDSMKQSVVDALGRYVELSDGDVQVSVTHDQDMGAVYSVSVPVRRVRQEARFALLEGGDDSLLDADGVSVAWDQGLEDLEEYDEDDWESDPSSRFPYGA